MSIDLIKDGEFHVTRSAGHGLCYVCNKRKREGDLGIFRAGAIDYEGQLDICQRCIELAGQQIGMIAQEDAVRLREDLAELREGNERLLAKVNELTELIEEQLPAVRKTLEGQKKTPARRRKVEEVKA